MLRPVTVITGFLGSGKSTLLNRLLKSPDLAGAAVIVNEFGEIPIDHILVQKAVDNAVILASGCICCTIRGDLVDTLLDLEARSASGEIPDFDRVLIETTGLADAAPVMQTLVSDFSLAGRYETTDVVTTVDASNALAQIERFPEARRQIAFADTIVVTKGDLVDHARMTAVVRAVGTINPFAAINVADDALPSIGRGRKRVIAEQVADGIPASHLSGSIRSWSFVAKNPLDPAKLKRWLLAITSLRGKSLLRLKGIVNIRGIDGAVVLQGVHHVLYPPQILPTWPDDNPRSRIVCITEGLDAGALESTRTFLTS